MYEICPDALFYNFNHRFPTKRRSSCSLRMIRIKSIDGAKQNSWDQKFPKKNFQKKSQKTPSKFPWYIILKFNCLVNHTAKVSWKLTKFGHHILFRTFLMIVFEFLILWFLVLSLGNGGQVFVLEIPICLKKHISFLNHFLHFYNI